MFKAANIVNILLETEDDFDLEEIVSAAPREPQPRIALRKVWSKWRIPEREYYMPEAKELIWRKDKWLDELGTPVQKTPRQRNLDVDHSELTYRFLNRRRAIPVDTEGNKPTLYRTPNYTKDVGEQEISIATTFIYLIEYSPEDLEHIYNNLWDWEDALRNWADYTNPDYNPLPT